MILFYNANTTIIINFLFIVFFFDLFFAFFHIYFVIVPANCTDWLPPMDISVNKVLLETDTYFYSRSAQPIEFFNRRCKIFINIIIFIVAIIIIIIIIILLLLL